MMKKTVGILIGIMMLSLGVMAQIKVKGTVTDADTGQPLVGGIVLQKGTTVGVITDMEGKYEINVAGESSILQFKAIGKDNVEEKVGKNTTINVSLKDSMEVKKGIQLYASDKEKVYEYNSKDDESQTFTTEGTIVLKGAEKEDKKTAIYIDGEKIDDVKSGTVIENARVSITKFNIAEEKDRFIVTINTNLNKGNVIKFQNMNDVEAKKPLIIVDGKPLQTEKAINEISPDSIESISVLKDKSATALYGEKGKNGVILIVTKKPQGE